MHLAKMTSDMNIKPDRSEHVENEAGFEHVAGSNEIQDIADDFVSKENENQHPWLRKLGPSEELKRRIKFRPKVSNYRGCALISEDEKVSKKARYVSNHDISEAFVQSHQNGRKSTKSGVHSILPFAFASALSEKNVSLHERRKESMGRYYDSHKINHEAMRYQYGRQMEPENLGKDLASERVVQMGTSVETIAKEHIGVKGYRDGGYNSGRRAKLG